MQKLKILTLLFLLSACSSTRYNNIKNERFNYSNENIQSDTESASNLDSFIEEWIGTPYIYGGMSKNGVDCSGFSSIVFLHVFGETLPRTARDQFLQGDKISFSRMQKGDLVFFNISAERKIDHVGIYLGNNRFAHATKSDGVIISNLTDDIYKDCLIGACRY